MIACQLKWFNAFKIQIDADVLVYSVAKVDVLSVLCFRDCYNINLVTISQMVFVVKNSDYDINIVNIVRKQ